VLYGILQQYLITINTAVKKLKFVETQTHPRRALKLRKPGESKVREKYLESDFGMLVMRFYIAHNLERKCPGIDYVLLNNYDNSVIRLHCFFPYEISS
jgi:hypothetical protein